jgi:hypothetical protein
MYYLTILIDNMAIFIYKKGQPLFFSFLAGIAAKDFSYLPEKEGETTRLPPYFPYPGCTGDKLNLYMKNVLSSFFYTT